MQERNRESSKRNRKSRVDHRGSTKENSRKIKSKDLNPVEKRNQRIQENKNKSRRADNRQTHLSSKKTLLAKREEKAKTKYEKIKKRNKRLSLKTSASKEKKSHRINERKSGALFTNKNFQRSDYLFFGLGLIFAYLFLLASSVDTIISEGLFFIYIGVLLLNKPRIYSQGVFVNVFVIVFILYALSAFLPNLPYFFPDWRTTAFNQFGINFGFLGTIMPLKSFEAFLMFVASIVLYYHISNWKLNNLGREAILIILIAVTALAGAIQLIAGNDTLGFLFSENYERSPIKHYFDNLNLFYLIGGLSSVTLFFDSFKSNKVISVIGFVGAFLFLFLLIHNQSFFYYSLFYSLSFLLVVRLYLRGKPIMLKLLTSILILSCLFVFLYFYQEWWSICVQDIGGFFIAKGKEFLWLMSGSFKQLNFFGNGIATAHAILPQLSSLENFKDDFSYRGSYLFAYISDFGMIGLVALTLFFIYWLSQYFKATKSTKMRHRFFYALIVIVFFARFLMLSEGLSVGLLLLLIIFLHLSLRIEKNYLSIFSKKFCQLMGVFWLCLGMFWISISVTNQPLLSDIRHRLSYADLCDENVDFKTLSLENIIEKDALISKSNPKKYFLKSYQLLESKADIEPIVKTLHKTAFLDQDERVYLLYGYLLSDYDINLAIDAFDAYFEDDPLSKLDDYRALIYYSKDNYELLLSLEILSYLANEYAVEWALLLNGLDFQKYVETNTLDRFIVSNKSTQFQFLKRLLEEGFFEQYDEYVAKYKNNISALNLLEAIKQKELANFEAALSILRKHIFPEKIEIFQANEDKKYISRVFLQNYPDIEMGVVLLKKAMEEENYEEALLYVDHILTMNNPPNYAYYWKAELLYKMKDYIDSWFAYVSYLEKANVQQFINKH